MKFALKESGGAENIRLRRAHLPYLLILPSMIVLLIVSIYPLIYAIFLSFHSLVLTKSSAGQFIGVSNYVALIHNPRFWISLKHTLFFASTSVGVSFILGFTLALLLNQSIKGKSIYRVILMVPMVLPPIVIGFGFRFMYNYDFGIFNYFLGAIGLPKYPFLAMPATALSSIIVADIWQWTPFMTLVLLAGLETVPLDLYEAGRIDGASTWQLFRHVTLPTIRPVMLVAVLIRTMDALREFDKIFIMTRGGPGEASETLNLYAWKSGFSWFRVSESTTIAIVMLVLIIGLSQLFIKAIGRKG